jgi:IBR domain, a half RING-finger domain
MSSFCEQNNALDFMMILDLYAQEVQMELENAVSRGEDNDYALALMLTFDDARLASSVAADALLVESMERGFYEMDIEVALHADLLFRVAREQVWADAILARSLSETEVHQSQQLTVTGTDEFPIHLMAQRLLKLTANDELTQAGQHELATGLVSELENPVLQMEDECDACCEQKPNTHLLQVPACRHKYCLGCLISMADAAIEDGVVSRLACCGIAIPDKLIRGLISEQKWKRLSALMSQNTQKRRMICAKCLELIPVDGIAASQTGRALCPNHRCQAEICTRCCSMWHAGQSCQTITVEADRAAVALGKARGWRRCPGCRILVEKADGCNCLTCRCGTAFCYKCGRKWSSKRTRGSHGTCEGGCELFQDYAADDR